MNEYSISYKDKDSKSVFLQGKKIKADSFADAESKLQLQFPGCNIHSISKLDS